MKTNNKKEITIKKWAVLNLLLAILFYIVILVGETMVYAYNTIGTCSGAEVSIVLVITLVIWICMYREIRTLTASNERFLGYKAYVLFFYKVLSIFALKFLTVLILYWGLGIMFVYLAVCLFYTLYMVIFVITMRKYKDKHDSKVYICYSQRIKNWHKEGEV